MEGIAFSVFAAERKEEYRICTQVIDRSQTRVVRKQALTESSKQHIQRIWENKKTLTVAYEKVPFFRVCPIVDHTEDWVDFEFQQGITCESWLDQQIREGNIKGVENFLSAYWDSLTQMSCGEFRQTIQFSNIFGDRLPQATPLHGAINQNIDLLFSNLFLSEEKKNRVVVTDYEWVFSFSIPLEYIYYRSIFCSIALSRAEEEEKKRFYRIAGIVDTDLDIFLEMEVAFQSHITGTMKTIPQMRNQFNISSDSFTKGLQSYEVNIYSGEQLTETKAKNRLEGELFVSSSQDLPARVQLGFPYNVIKISDKCQMNWSCENAVWSENNIYAAGVVPLVFRAKGHGDISLQYTILGIDTYEHQNAIRQQMLRSNELIESYQAKLNMYQAEWKLLEEAGKIDHAEPVDLIRSKQRKRENEQSAAGSGPDVTIVIPTKNGGNLFQMVLDHVFGQVTQYTYEVICVDSGSSDQTLEIIQNSAAKLYQIPAEDFGHGKTRNYGASLGSGEFICFITQDALPANESWLENMINAMKLDPQIAGGFGRHLPYSQCNFIDERDINGLFEGFGNKDTIYWMDDKKRYETDPGYRSVLAFFSDNNSCLRRSVWEQNPYPDVEFAEDQIWMRAMIEKGYKKVYCPKSMVYHSHNYDPSTYFMRYYDEHKGLYEIHGYMNVASVWKIPAATCKHVISDMGYIRSQSGSRREKLHMVVYSIRRNYARYMGGHLGGHYHLQTAPKQKKWDQKYSQQYRQRKGIVEKNN